jgi:hypothetical protein
MSRTIGSALIVCVLIASIWGAFAFATREKVAGIAPIYGSRDNTRSIPLSPVAGGLALLGSIAMLATARKS